MANLFGLPTPEEVRQQTRGRLFQQINNQRFGGMNAPMNRAFANLGGLFGSAMGGESAKEQRAGKIQAINTQFGELWNAEGNKAPESAEELATYGTKLAGEFIRAGETDVALSIMDQIGSADGKGNPAKPTQTTKGLITMVDGKAQYVKDPNTGEVLQTPATDIEARGKMLQKEAQVRASQKVADRAFNTIDTIRGNVSNLAETKRLIESGAQTGAITDLFPSLKASTVALKNMQGRLALDVIGSVTFGALSKGELDLAKTTALPTGLAPKELSKWLDNKISAQNKLMAYFEEQALFLNEGNTRADWVKHKKAQRAETKVRTVDW